MLPVIVKVGLPMAFKVEVHSYIQHQQHQPSRSNNLADTHDRHVLRRVSRFILFHSLW